MCRVHLSWSQGGVLQYKRLTVQERSTGRLNYLQMKVGIVERRGGFPQFGIPPPVESHPSPSPWEGMMGLLVQSILFFHFLFPT